MFEKHEVWQRGEEFILIHVVFRNLATGLYHCQQTNYLYPGKPEDIRQQMSQHDYYTADQFWNDLPSIREKGYLTMYEAIEAHIRDFKDMKHL
jgi:hypothetical protein